MPIAEQAQERYNLGTVSNNMPKMFPTLQRRLSGMRNIKATTVQGKPGLFSNAASISLITGQQYNGKPDTVYVETPKHMPFMNVQPRMAGQNVGPGNYSMEEANDYNVLGRRFNLAKSVSAKQLGGTMAQQKGLKGQQGIEQQVAQLVQAAVAGDLQATQQIEKIMQAAQLGDQQAVQIALIIQKVIQSMKAKQGVKAQLGAKLDYLNKLKGVCPEGTEKIYLKNGGCMCKQKAQKGTELKKKDNKMNAILKFKAEKAEKGTKAKVAYHDIDKKTYEKLPESTRINADNHYLGRATSDNTNGSYNISHKPTAADSTTIDRKHMSPDMLKKYPLKKTEKNACGSKMKKKK